MWHWGTLFSGGPDRAGLTGGLSVLRELFQPNLCDLMSDRGLSRSIENGGWPDIYTELKYRNTVPKIMKHIFLFYTATVVQFNVFTYQLVWIISGFFSQQKKIIPIKLLEIHIYHLIFYQCITFKILSLMFLAPYSQSFQPLIFLSLFLGPILSRTGFFPDVNICTLKKLSTEPATTCTALD